MLLLLLLPPAKPPAGGGAAPVEDATEVYKPRGVPIGDAAHRSSSPLSPPPPLAVVTRGFIIAAADRASGTPDARPVAPAAPEGEEKAIAARAERLPRLVALAEDKGGLPPEEGPLRRDGVDDERSSFERDRPAAAAPVPLPLRPSSLVAFPDVPPDALFGVVLLLPPRDAPRGAAPAESLPPLPPAPPCLWLLLPLLLPPAARPFPLLPRRPPIPPPPLPKKLGDAKAALILPALPIGTAAIAGVRGGAGRLPLLFGFTEPPSPVFSRSAACWADLSTSIPQLPSPPASLAATFPAEGTASYFFATLGFASLRRFAGASPRSPSSSFSSGASSEARGRVAPVRSVAPPRLLLLLPLLPPGLVAPDPAPPAAENDSLLPPFAVLLSPTLATEDANAGATPWATPPAPPAAAIPPPSPLPEPSPLLLPWPAQEPERESDEGGNAGALDLPRLPSSALAPRRSGPFCRPGVRWLGWPGGIPASEANAAAEPASPLAARYSWMIWRGGKIRPTGGVNTCDGGAGANAGEEARISTYAAETPRLNNTFSGWVTKLKAEKATPRNEKKAGGNGVPNTSRRILSGGSGVPHNERTSVVSEAVDPLVLVNIYLRFKTAVHETARTIKSRRKKKLTPSSSLGLNVMGVLATTAARSRPVTAGSISPLLPTVPLSRPATLAMICFAASLSWE